MAVLIEAYSIVIRKEAILTKMIGGWDKFIQTLPNNTLCDDGEIVRVGFMNGHDANVYLTFIMDKGLSLVSGGEANDIALVDQNKGILTNCDWLEFDNIKMFDLPTHTFSVCTYKTIPGLENDEGQKEKLDGVTIATPPGWNALESSSADIQYADRAEFEKRYDFLRMDGNLYVYLDLETHKEVYIGRTNNI